MGLRPRTKSFDALYQAFRRRYSVRRASLVKCSLAVTGPQPSQASVIEKLSHGWRCGGAAAAAGGRGPGAAVLMVTPEFSRWLEDRSFVSRVMGVLYRKARDLSSIELLSGVVDGFRVLPTPEDGGESTVEGPQMQRGLSILYSSRPDLLLPGLWDNEPTSDPNQASAISFAMTPEAEDWDAGPTGRWEVTLPLANTVFQNGRRSTLFASQWGAGNGSGEPTDLTKMVEKRHQTVYAMGSTSIKSHIPLLPLTPPRKIVAGLGNIVRQVEVDGSVGPASKELEFIIPRLFERRYRVDQTVERRPIGIWAWVIPPQVVESGMLKDINPSFVVHPQSSESELASRVAPILDELIQHGCRLHKILSGGGGWGTKQGLLSLDPETTYPLIEDEDAEIERFIKAFEQRGDEVQPDGLVTPGSYLLFCTEPQDAKEEEQNRQGISSARKTGLILGVAPETEQTYTDDFGSKETTVKLYDNQFGACSSAGMYLQKGSFATKIDVPRTVLVQELEPDIQER